MASYQSFEELPIWQDARKLVGFACQCTRSDSFSRDFGLKDQIQRAAVSVMTNIAEGFERRTRKEFCQFLNYAKASSGEVRSLGFVALDQQYISEAKFSIIYSSTDSLSRSICGFISYLSAAERESLPASHSSD